VIPLYGFLEGDTLGLLVLAREQDTALAEKLQEAAALRVAPEAGARVWVRGEPLEPSVTVARAGLQALDMFEVRVTAGGAERAP
jgi:hypothetical protein